MARLAEGVAPSATRNWPTGPPIGCARRSLKPIDISLSQSPLTDASRSRGFLPAMRIGAQYNTTFQGLATVGRRPTGRCCVGERTQHIPLLHDSGAVKLCQKRAGPFAGATGGWGFWVLGARCWGEGFTTEATEGAEGGEIFQKCCISLVIVKLWWGEAPRRFFQKCVILGHFVTFPLLLSSYGGGTVV